jgi:hypothetical protein
VSVIVVRAVIDGPDRAAVDYLAADGKWTCSAHPTGKTCPHLAALVEHVAGAALKQKPLPRTTDRKATP